VETRKEEERLINWHLTRYKNLGHLRHQEVQCQKKRKFCAWEEKKIENPELGKTRRQVSEGKAREQWKGRGNEGQERREGKSKEEGGKENLNSSIDKRPLCYKKGRRNTPNLKKNEGKQKKGGGILTQRFAKGERKKANSVKRRKGEKRGGCRKRKIGWKENAHSTGGTAHKQ